MNNPKQILWTDLNSAPPKNYLWQKEDGIYTNVNGNWIKTKSFGKEEVCEDENESEVKDLSCQYLLRSEKMPKYVWMYNTSDTAKYLFDTDIVIGGDYQSPNAHRLVIDFEKINNLGLLNKFVTDCGIGSIGLGMIWEPEDNFQLEENDIKGIHISKVGKKFEVTIEYYDDTLEFNPNGIYETEIEGSVYYEYDPTVGGNR